MWYPVFICYIIYRFVQPFNFSFNENLTILLVYNRLQVCYNRTKDDEKYLFEHYCGVKNIFHQKLDLGIELEYSIP